MLDLFMVFYLDKIFQMMAKKFWQNGLKNIIYILLISLTDVAIFLLIGVSLSALGNVRVAVFGIVALFVVVSLMFIGHRLFMSQIGSIYDSSLMEHFAQSKADSEQGLYTLIIASHKNAVINSTFSLINIAVSIICLCFINIFEALVALVTMVVYVYIAGRNIQKVTTSCATYITAFKEAEQNDVNREFTPNDNIVYQQAKMYESNAETSALLKIVCIVGWAVSCLVPIIEQLPLSEFILAAVMLLYIVSQSFVISQCYDSIIIVRYCISQLDKN